MKRSTCLTALICLAVIMQSACSVPPPSTIPQKDSPGKLPPAAGQRLDGRIVNFLEAIQRGEPAPQAAQAQGMRLEEQGLLVDIYLKEISEPTLDQLRQRGFQLLASDADNRIVAGYLPPQAILAVAQMEVIQAILPVSAGVDAGKEGPASTVQP
jgi:hypothetical protein